MSDALPFLDSSSTVMWREDATDREETHTRTHSVFHLLQRAASTCGRTENRKHTQLKNIMNMFFFYVHSAGIAADLLGRSVCVCVLGSDGDADSHLLLWLHNHRGFGYSLKRGPMKTR